MTLLVVTHERDVALRLTDRALVLDRGKLVREGTTSHILEPERAGELA
jgi:ABC-type glutathione transport system ATPase component